MNYADFLVMAIGSCVTLLYFVNKTEIERSKAKVRVYIKDKKS